MKIDSLNQVCSEERAPLSTSPALTTLGIDKIPDRYNTHTVLCHVLLGEPDTDSKTSDA